MEHKKLTWGQITVLAATSLLMAAIGVAGAVATYVNMNDVLHRSASALGLVAAGEGATLIAALVSLAVTLMGQHTPVVVRVALWVIPLTASATGVALARNANESIVMGVTPMAMTAAGEGIGFVARRVVAFRTRTDIEQQRRSGLLLWHANRAANGKGIGRWMSNAAVWRLTKSFAATDNQLSVQLGEIQRYRIGQGADTNLAAVLSGEGDNAPELPTGTPAAPSPVLPPLSPREAVSGPPVASSLDATVPAAKLDTELAKDDGYAFIQAVIAEGEANIKADPAVQLLTTADVAGRRGVAAGTVRSWVHRKRLRVHDRDADGRPLFHPLDVDALD